jgi:hypothetical protein
MSETTPERKSTEDITSAPLHSEEDKEEESGHRVPSNVDHEKHEYSATLSDSDNSSTIEASERSALGVSISRTVSEVRDGIANQRDLERGDDAVEKTPTVRVDDPNVVKWTGPDDPENPKNWLLKRKWAAVFCGKSLCVLQFLI